MARFVIIASQMRHQAKIGEHDAHAPTVVNRVADSQPLRKVRLRCRKIAPHASERTEIVEHKTFAALIANLLIDMQALLIERAPGGVIFQHASYMAEVIERQRFAASVADRPEDAQTLLVTVTRGGVIFLIADHRAKNVERPPFAAPIAHFAVDPQTLLKIDSRRSKITLSPDDNPQAKVDFSFGRVIANLLEDLQALLIKRPRQCIIAAFFGHAAERYQRVALALAIADPTGQFQPCQCLLPGSAVVALPNKRPRPGLISAYGNRCHAGCNAQGDSAACGACRCRIVAGRVGVVGLAFSNFGLPPRIQLRSQLLQGNKILLLCRARALQVIGVRPRQQQLVAIFECIRWRQLQRPRQKGNSFGVRVLVGGLDAGQPVVMPLALDIFGMAVVVGKQGIIWRKLHVLSFEC